MLATPRAGSSDSAAAIVAISAPQMAKITMGTPAITAWKPNGMNPPWSTMLPKVGAGEVMPSA
ncbi:hypothetical protein D3C76_392460 [compost metagenome]